MTIIVVIGGAWVLWAIAYMVGHSNGRASGYQQGLDVWKMDPDGDPEKWRSF